MGFSYYKYLANIVGTSRGDFDVFEVDGCPYLQSVKMKRSYKLKRGRGKEREGGNRWRGVNQLLHG